MLEIYSHAVVFMVMKLNDKSGMQVRLQGCYWKLARLLQMHEPARMCMSLQARCKYPARMLQLGCKINPCMIMNTAARLLQMGACKNVSKGLQHSCKYMWWHASFLQGVCKILEAGVMLVLTRVLQNLAFYLQECCRKVAKILDHFWSCTELQDSYTELQDSYKKPQLLASKYSTRSCQILHGYSSWAWSLSKWWHSTKCVGRMVIAKINFWKFSWLQLHTT